MKKIVSSIFIGAISASTVVAQTPGAMQQVDSTQQRRANERAATALRDGDSVPSIYPGEDSDVGPQSVLSVTRKSYFEAAADVQYFYTDNMFLGDDFKKSADVLVSMAQVALAPTPYELNGGEFAPRLGYRHQWFSFGLLKSDRVTVLDLSKIGIGGAIKDVRLSRFDFNAQTFFTDASWSRENWIAHVGFDYSRLLSSRDYGEFYREFVPRWGLQRIVPVNDSVSVALGYTGDYRFTTVDKLPSVASDDYHNRTDHSLFGSLTYSPCENVFLQPFYQLTYTHYTESDNRNDFLHSLGCGIYYYFTPRLSARLFAAYDIRRSDEAQDYEKFDGGAGLNVTFRF